MKTDAQCNRKPIELIKGIKDPKCQASRPRQLGIEYARYGDFTQESQSTDPLIVKFTNYEPGAKIQFVDLSQNPAADFSCDEDVKSFPGGTDIRRMKDGSLIIVLNNELADELDIKPGASLQFRQVNTAGEPSRPSEIVKLRQTATRSSFDISDTSDFQDFNTGLTPGRYLITDRKDQDGPVVRTDRLQISPGDTDQWFLTGCKAVEPDAKITVENLTTGGVYAGTERDGEVKVDLKAHPGDVLGIKVTDWADNETDLGVTRLGFVENEHFSKVEPAEKQEAAAA